MRRRAAAARQPGPQGRKPAARHARHAAARERALVRRRRLAEHHLERHERLRRDLIVPPANFKVLRVTRGLARRVLELPQLLAWLAQAAHQLLDLHPERHERLLVDLVPVPPGDGLAHALGVGLVRVHTVLLMEEVSVLGHDKLGVVLRHLPHRNHLEQLDHLRKRIDHAAVVFVHLLDQALQWFVHHLVSRILAKQQEKLSTVNGSTVISVGFREEMVDVIVM
mmetsp:Transcript_65901/g.176583  ORF Transcript_65901/g.176583 Transcript_65901/m.176583 type:complete len:224 (-) Transcript_65901:210-881(-)